MSAPAWSTSASPWGPRWDEVVERPEWFARFPDAPPRVPASALGEKLLRGEPDAIPRVFVEDGLILGSALGRHTDLGAERYAAHLATIDVSRARAALDDPSDVDALVSPAADALREDLFTRAAALHRGRVELYAPLYLSNACTNRCVYCGFRHGSDIARVTLSPDDVEREAEALRATGLRHVLLLTGETRDVGVDYLEAAIARVKRYFDKISVEVLPLDVDGYSRLAAAGVSGVTLYQETYDLRRYLEVHPGGRKRNYPWRIAGPERALAGNIPRVGLGALLGLGDWRFECAALVHHVRALARLHPGARAAPALREATASPQMTVSFPRIRPAAGQYRPTHPVDDAAMLHMMSVVRLALPGVRLVLSTREGAELRDRLATTLVDVMSAGSRTEPGGYAEAEPAGGAQFAIEDHRSVAEVAEMLRARGTTVEGLDARA
ncbi:radical SAM protein [Myxococcota bacterium]|nr:radical SAM protein [Myxococcota bacterium]